MQYRYAKAATPGLNLPKLPYLLTFKRVVPVVGLEQGQGIFLKFTTP
jgi:hypothetical protein